PSSSRDIAGVSAFLPPLTTANSARKSAEAGADATQPRTATANANLACMAPSFAKGIRRKIRPPIIPERRVRVTAAVFSRLRLHSRPPGLSCSRFVLLQRSVVGGAPDLALGAHS